MLDSFRSRIAAGYAKAFRFPSLGAGDAYGAGGLAALSSMGWMLPGTRYDWQREASPCWLNGVVLSGVSWICRTWPEAPQVLCQRKKDGTEDLLTDHPALELLAHPNDDYDDSVLWHGTQISLACNGNAYWYKVRNGQRRPIALQYLPHFSVEPFWPKDGSRFIDGYAYKVGGETMLLPREDIVHLRRGIDPLNIRKGLADLAAELRAICQDNEAQTFGAVILKNFGVPGVLLTPEDADAQISPEQAEELKRLWRERFTGDGRGDPLGSPARIKIQQVSMSPQDLALESLARMPASRICAALGLDPMVLGLPSESKTYSNYSEAMQAAWENTLIPSQTALNSQLTLQLLSDFTNDRSLRFGHDYSAVRALQPDLDAQYKRQTDAVGGPWLCRNEARQMIGLDPIDGGDELYESRVPAMGSPGAEEKPPVREDAKALWAARVRERRLEAERAA